jgi:hypothetical protein
MKTSANYGMIARGKKISAREKRRRVQWVIVYIFIKGILGIFSVRSPNSNMFITM